MTEVVGIINYGMGNLRSVSNAFEHIGFDTRYVETSDQVSEVSHLVVPGVGAFHTAMGRLVDLGLDQAIREFAASGRPVLGLCLGMQLLGSAGTEGSGSEGLGLIPGTIRRLPAGRPIPHVGWNSMSTEKSHPILERVKSGRDFYFVHSFWFDPADESDVLGRTDYGSAFPCAVARDNVVGFQFHPEKSQVNGLQILENFGDWDGTC